MGPNREGKDLAIRVVILYVAVLIFAGPCLALAVQNEHGTAPPNYAPPNQLLSFTFEVGTVLLAMSYALLVLLNTARKRSVPLLLYKYNAIALFAWAALTFVMYLIDNGVLIMGDWTYYGEWIDLNRMFDAHAPYMLLAPIVFYATAVALSVLYLEKKYRVN